MFAPEPGTIYLDTATYGLLPRPTVEAMQQALLAWQAGSADWVEDWERAGDETRVLFARLIGASVDEIALVPTVSVGVGPVVAALRAGDEVVVPDEEFTSVLFPLLVAEQRRGVVVRQAPFDRLAEAITGRTTLVAFSLVQSQGGGAADLSGICAAARQHGARVLVDATHALPFYPIADHLPRSTPSSVTVINTCSVRGEPGSVTSGGVPRTPFPRSMPIGARSNRSTRGPTAVRSHWPRCPAVRRLARLAGLGRGAAVDRADGRVAGGRRAGRGPSACGRPRASPR